jgi:hypothetical protein
VREVEAGLESESGVGSGDEEDALVGGDMAIGARRLLDRKDNECC